MKAIIDRTAANEKLEEIHFRCKRENIEADQQNSQEEQEKTDLLIALENSRSFARTHEIIGKLGRYNTWSQDEIELLCRIAVNNSQVRYIIQDSDVKLFYVRLLKQTRRFNEDMKTVKDLIENEE